MYNEFSLSLKNIKKLVNEKEGSRGDMRNQIHVSDYTDKDKSVDSAS